MIYTLFISPKVTGYTDDVDDFVLSNAQHLFGEGVRQNVLYQRFAQYVLANAATKAIAFPSYTSADWAYIIARVKGSARINTAGFDYDGVTAITGKLPIFGTQRYPGIGVISTYNVSTFTLESLADGTVIELFAAIAAKDDDARLDANA